MTPQTAVNDFSAAPAVVMPSAPQNGSQAATGARTANWDTLVELGRQALQALDQGRWLIGDAAAAINTIYGQSDVARYAREINASETAVREYRTMAEYYRPEERQQLLASPVLTYSHLRAAARMKDFDASLAILEAAAANAWTVRELTARVMEAGGQAPRLRLFDAEVVLEPVTTDGERGLFVPLDQLDPLAADDLLKFVRAGEPLRVVVHAPKSAVMRRGGD